MAIFLFLPFVLSQGPRTHIDGFYQTFSIPFAQCRVVSMIIIIVVVVGITHMQKGKRIAPREFHQFQPWRNKMIQLASQYLRERAFVRFTHIRMQSRSRNVAAP